MTATPALPSPEGAPPNEPPDEVEASRAPLMDHLNELRTRLVRILWAIMILFIGGWLVSQQALAFLLVPMSESALRHHADLKEAVAVYQAPLELLFIQFKVAFLIAIAAGFPFIAYQAYGFVAPGLYKTEKAAVMPFLFVMPILFLAGAALVYYEILPSFMDLSFKSEFKAAGIDVKYQPKIKEYYELAIGLLMAFGLAFQLPVVISLLARAGVVNVVQLRKWRKFAFLIILVIAAAVTPPDPFSQFIFGLPLYLLYESGIITAAVIARGKRKREEAEEKEAAREAVAETSGAKPA